jgi:hypothetical protein
MLKHYTIFLLYLFLLYVPIVNAEMTNEIGKKYDIELIEKNVISSFEVYEDKADRPNDEIIDKKVMSEKNYQYAKNSCPNYGYGKWNDDKMICEINDPKEMAAYEDHICDEPTAKIEYPTIC